MSEEFKIGDIIVLIDSPYKIGEIVGIYKKSEDSIVKYPDYVYLVIIEGWPYWKEENSIKKLENKNE